MKTKDKNQVKNSYIDKAVVYITVSLVGKPCW